jgi:predicted AlkP superfamily phosphohydrolase/phosphomutase
LEGKYPRGSVKPEDREAIISELEVCLNSLEIDGRKAIKRICRKEEIYHGPHLGHAPDLVLLGNKGLDFKSGLKATKLAGRGVFTGKHSQKDAFLLINKPSPSIIPESPSVSDVVGIMNKLRERHDSK